MPVNALEYAKSQTASNESFDIKDETLVNGELYTDDSGISKSLMNKENFVVEDDDSDLLKVAMHGANLYTANEIKRNLYTNAFRFGVQNPYGAISTGREYLFFTKPDLNIYDTDDSLHVSNSLQEGLASIPFWRELNLGRKDTTLKSLQASRDFSDPFNYLLQNTIISNLEVPGLTSETIDTPVNMYGVGFSYRGSSEASDNNPTFTLEFKDTRYLDVYTYFKAYEEYETLKHHGVIKPSDYYIKNKILHDQFAIYKFIVGDDMETILYYGKMYGVMPLSLPRDVFSSATFENGLSYSIDFKAAFYEDMKPDILADFNTLSKDIYNNSPYQINPYNPELGRGDTRPAKAAAIIKDTTSAAAQRSTSGYVYKLKWRGDIKI